MTHDILGDKPKHNFDDNLADKVNKIFDNMPEEKPKNNETAQRASGNKIQDIILTSNDYTKMTVGEWAGFFGQNKYGSSKIVFASMPDIYRTIKHFKKWHEEKTFDVEVGDNIIQSWLNSIKKAFSGENRLLTSTRLEYYASAHAPTTIDIKHHAGFEEFEEKISVNYINNANFWTLIEEKEGLAFLRGLFDTKDSGREIRKVIEYIAEPMQVIMVIVPADANIPQHVSDPYNPLVAYASLKVYTNYSSISTLAIDLTTRPDEKGCARGVIAP
ncbi:hypothetical protein HZA97_01120 [Candidatus Woesearchaeota archaeon]|nr:hypothetical protein [Candidatus Woesearchaeota archaeon]